MLAHFQDNDVFEGSINNNEIFYLYRHGAEVVDPRISSQGRSSMFTGTGYRLGQSNNDSEGNSGFLEMFEEVLLFFHDDCIIIK